MEAKAGVVEAQEGAVWAAVERMAAEMAVGTVEGLAVVDVGESKAGR